MGNRAWDWGRGVRWAEGAVTVLGISTNGHVLLNLENVVYVLH